MSDKPIKNAVSYVIYNDDVSKFIVVQRPADDEDLPDAWGLPAGSLKEAEDFADAVIRSGREKLGVVLEPQNMLKEGDKEREKYTLHMELFEARVVEGEVTVPQLFDEVTQYQQWKWADADILIDAAKKGSLCCRLYLDFVELDWK